MKKAQIAVTPTIHPFSHPITHSIFPLVQHLLPRPSPGTLPKKEVSFLFFNFCNDYFLT